MGARRGKPPASPRPRLGAPAVLVERDLRGRPMPVLGMHAVEDAVELRGPARVRRRLRVGACIRPTRLDDLARGRSTTPTTAVTSAHGGGRDPGVRGRGAHRRPGRRRGGGSDGRRRDAPGASVIVAAGSTPFIPPIHGVDEVPYWTSRDATSTRELPSSLVILGGGVVGVELAQVFVRFGVASRWSRAATGSCSREHPLTSKHVADQLVEEGLRAPPGVVGQRGPGRRRGADRARSRTVRPSRAPSCSWRSGGDPRTSARWASRRPAPRWTTAGRPRPTIRCGSPTDSSSPETWRAACSSRTSPTTKAASPPGRRRAVRTGRTSASCRR